MRYTVLFAILAVLLLGGCNKTNSAIKEMAKKPDPTTVEQAKALAAEVDNLIRWHEKAEVPDMNPEQLQKAEALLEKREVQLSQLREQAAEKAIREGVGKAKEWLKSADLKGKAEWVLGKDAPQRKRYAGPEREPTDPAGAKDWP